MPEAFCSFLCVQRASSEVNPAVPCFTWREFTQQCLCFVKSCDAFLVVTEKLAQGRLSYYSLQCVASPEDPGIQTRMQRLRHGLLVPYRYPPCNRKTLQPAWAFCFCHCRLGLCHRLGLCQPVEDNVPAECWQIDDGCRYLAPYWVLVVSFLYPATCAWEGNLKAFFHIINVAVISFATVAPASLANTRADSSCFSQHLAGHCSINVQQI